MSKRILFVDDEPMVLKGLERSLHNMRDEWEMRFVPGGPEALEAMIHAPFDVVISDMRMPGMDGAQLLDLVKQRFAQTVRMVLSGQSDRDALFRAIRPTHQYLAKPCDVEELKQKLRCAFALRDVLKSPELKQTVSRVETLPSQPALYDALRAELQGPDPNLRKAAAIVRRDPSMTAKLLQLVNSAFLGKASRICCSKQAISAIGLDNLRTLVLSNSLFSALPPTLADMLAPLWAHSYATARSAQAIARCQRASETTIQDCFTAGLLHEVGWIILVSTTEDQFKRLCLTVGKELLDGDREGRSFAATTGQIGAYLLGLWGLPEAIIEAVAWRHAPSHANPSGFSPLLAVHVADKLDCRRDRHSPVMEDDAIDENLLAHLGLKDRLPVWRRQCQEIDDQSFDLRFVEEQ